MTFIITLVSLVTERFFDFSHLRRWGWFTHYQAWMNQRVVNLPPYLALLACLVPPVLIVALIGKILSGWLFGLPQLIFGVIVVVYCLGPQNLWVQMYSCITAAQKGDPKAAIDQMQQVFGIKAPKDSQSFHQTLTRTLFVESDRRVFAVLFWFVVLGPAGAVLYRLVALSTLQSGIAPAAEKAQQILDWLPARVMTFIFALSGHFTEVFVYWKRYATGGLNTSDTLLADCGVAALDVEVEGNKIPEDGSVEQKAMDLLDRVFVMAVVILAIIVLLT